MFNYLLVIVSTLMLNIIISNTAQAACTEICQERTVYDCAAGPENGLCPTKKEIICWDECGPDATNQPALNLPNDCADPDVRYRVNVQGVCVIGWIVQTILLVLLFTFLGGANT